MVRYVDLVNKKRLGKEHTKEEIQQIIQGVMTSELEDYQLSAWLMAVCLNGMTLDESAYLTEAMFKSGDVMDLSSLGEYVIDKHSTGGVGDKATLILSPMIASVGLPMAKLSGKGLGHTGGTIDKLESIPGFNTYLSVETFLNQIKEIGLAIGGQTAKLAPADGIIYSMRDVTATVESIPLIAASVLSKKIASGANVIVLDVKYGSGAFMKTVEDATELSNTMVEIGNRLGKKVTCVVTSMEQPLGNAVGNSLEVIESIETLKGKGPEDLTEICLILSAISIYKAGAVSSIEEGKKLLWKNIQNGNALKKFEALLKAQGGDTSIINDYSKLPQAKLKYEFKAEAMGYLTMCDALMVAQGCKVMGAGRDKKEDPVNYGVGVVVKKKVSDSVKTGDVLAEIYSDDAEKLDQAIAYLQQAFVIESTQPKKPELISLTIGV